MVMGMIKFNLNNSEQIIEDKRSKCWSVALICTIKEYVDWYDFYGKRNKLPEQRDVVISTTTNKIKKRLIDDLVHGAVIPPIVLGLNVEGDYITKESVVDVINEHIDEAAVIDGIQRSDALRIAIGQNSEIESRCIRLEIWVTSNPINLIYRMLVLNTGQIPWSTKKQLEVVYKPLLDYIKHEISEIQLYPQQDKKNKDNRNIDAIEESEMIELFMVFANRKEVVVVNTKNKLADDFSRLELIKMTENEYNPKLFIRTLKLMIKLNETFSKYIDGSTNEKQDDSVSKKQFVDGKDLFVKFQAKVGFVAAVSSFVLGRLGSTERENNDKESMLGTIEGDVDCLVEKFEVMDPESKREFFKFDTLNQIFDDFPKIRIGERQRNFFRKAFGSLIENKFDITTMEELWLDAVYTNLG